MTDPLRRRAEGNVAAGVLEAGAAPVATREAPLDWAAEARAVRVVWLREVLRFSRARIRITTGFVQPVLFLLVLGTGLRPLVGETGGVDFRTFVFPGVVSMAVVTTAMGSAVSIVWDREFGFLREMLVAPVSRFSIALGKTLGGATVSTFQGAVLLVLAPLAGVRLTVAVVAGTLAAAMVLAFTMTAFGVAVASRMQRLESFSVVMNFFMLPMLFLSGALFPLGDLPGWLTVLTHLDPLTYAVDPLRRAAFSGVELPPAALERFPVGVEVGGAVLAVPVEIAVVLCFAGVCLLAAVRSLSRKD